MIVKVSGLVMEIRSETDRDTKKELATKTAMLFQKGDKMLITLKRLPAGMFAEGDFAKDVEAKVLPWAFDGSKAEVTMIYAGAI